MSGGQVSCPRIVHTGMQSPQSIYATSLKQEHPIGEPGTLTGGRVFYYARYSHTVAHTFGKLLVAATPLTTSTELACTAGALSAGSNEFGKTGTITFGAATAVKDEFQYLQVIDGPGEGESYRIKHHAAIASGGTVTGTLFDVAVTTSTTATQVLFQKDPYADVIVSVADQADLPAGICPVAIPLASAAAPRYVWVQTQGPALAVCNGTDAEGTKLVCDTATVGNLIVATVATFKTIATKMQVGVDDECQSVDLCIRGV